MSAMTMECGAPPNSTMRRSPAVEVMYWMNGNAASWFFEFAGMHTAKPPVSEPQRVPTGCRA